ncbi:hypothetical protein Fraau_0753 [Frateuria aurantia DSM 6220]|uniref:Uncharacterized protein n=2 Tax=Frateuria aurantia TaxID=81475 RepID=H8KZC1_FRAAD|nr:hypothetical protein Fraau_0753 [Frateuria aurantia DSM 6220]
MRRYLRIQGHVEQALQRLCFHYHHGRLAGWLRMIDAMVEVAGSEAVVDAFKQYLSARWQQGSESARNISSLQSKPEGHLLGDMGMLSA